MTPEEESGALTTLRNELSNIVNERDAWRAECAAIRASLSNVLLERDTARAERENLRIERDTAYLTKEALVEDLNAIKKERDELSRQIAGLTTNALGQN